MLELVVKATVILALAGLAASALQRGSAAVRHLVWLTALVSVLLLPAVMLMAPAWHPTLPATVVTAVQPARTVVNVFAEQPGFRFTPVQWLWAIWFAGVALVTIRATAARIRVAGWARRARGFADAGPIPVRISAEVSVPLVCGLRKPVILLPEEASAWPAERLRLVLAHESMHISRRDTWAQLLSQAVCALYWPHPLVWLAAAHLHKECEQACDDGVLALGEKASLYAEHLVEIVRGLAAPLPEGGIAMIRVSELERRLAALLNPNRNRRAAGPRLALTVCTCAAAVLIPLAALRAPAQQGSGLTGVVKDPSGAVIPRARVTAAQEGTDRREFTIANAAGEFTLAPLPAGLYDVTVAAPGFARYESKGVSVGPLGAVRIDVNLAIGRVAETLTVNGEAAPRPVNPPAPGGAPPSRIRVGGNVQANKVINMVRPVYPADCKLEHVEGTVEFRAIIGRDGNLLSVTQVNQLVDPRLAQAAKDAVSQWQYQPTLLNGEPVEVITEIDVNFTLTR